MNGHKNNKGGDDLYNEPFEAFKNSKGKSCDPSDTFDVKKFGFMYNTSFPAPKYAAIKNVTNRCNVFKC